MTLNGGFGCASIFDRMLESNRIIPPAMDAFVHNLIRAHAEQDPDLQAICSSDGNLTYGELEDLSSQLAAHLVTQGVGPEVIVPLCFERSKWTIVGLFGTLKAGGAFDFLDPFQPVARLEYFVKEQEPLSLFHLQHVWVPVRNS
jgi:non-ribosomal peptide synthetase component F